MEEIISWDEWVVLSSVSKRCSEFTCFRYGSTCSDEGIEDVIYDSYALRKFMGINFVDEQVPDATTLLKFRHLLQKNHILTENI